MSTFLAEVGEWRKTDQKWSNGEPIIEVHVGDGRWMPKPANPLAWKLYKAVIEENDDVFSKQ